MQAQARDWNTAPLRELIQHIVSIHHEYLKLELPRLEKRLDQALAAGSGADVLQSLPHLFLPMKDELELHMHKEELMLFPAIEQMARPGSPAVFPFGSLSNPVRVMMAEHDNAFEALSEMRRVTGNYAPTPDADAGRRQLFEGFDALERDLRQHIHLENDILFPRAIALESGRG
jgi:regulator of cell morphogenesis and NO signaling